MAKAEVRTKIKPNLKLEEPSMYKVVYLNDDVTTMDFVIDSLVEFFAYTEETALDITDKVHEEGSAVVAVLPYEIADQKKSEITMAARKNGFPLQVKLEIND